MNVVVEAASCGKKSMNDKRTTTTATIAHIYCCTHIPVCHPCSRAQVWVCFELKLNGFLGLSFAELEVESDFALQKSSIFNLKAEFIEFPRLLVLSFDSRYEVMCVLGRISKMTLTLNSDFTRATILAFIQGHPSSPLWAYLHFDFGSSSST